MAGVLSKILGSIDHEPFAPEEVNSIRDAFSIYFFSGALLEILILLETQTLFYTTLEHFS